MIVLHLLQLNGSVNYYRKWKLISSEVGVKLKNEENSKFSKKIIKKSKIVVQTYWTHVRPVHPPVGAPVDRYSADNRYSMEWRYGPPVNAEVSITCQHMKIGQQAFLPI